ncbi:HpcH/HpaI aldolase/citrate lyase family protein [Azotobacter armeniacus]
MLRVSVEDLNSARLILGDGTAAVFKHGGAMCEPATHCKWARNMLERAHWNSVQQESPVMPLRVSRI